MSKEMNAVTIMRMYIFYVSIFFKEYDGFYLAIGKLLVHIGNDIVPSRGNETCWNLILKSSAKRINIITNLLACQNGFMSHATWIHT